MAERLQLRDTPMAGATSAPVAACNAPAHLAIESGIASGFQMACAAGPLCQDPLWGVAMELSIGLAQDGFDFSAEAWAGLDLREGTLGPVSGQVRRRPRIDAFASRSLVASTSSPLFLGFMLPPSELHHGRRLCRLSATTQARGAGDRRRHALSHTFNDHTLLRGTFD